MERAGRLLLGAGAALLLLAGVALSDGAVRTYANPLTVLADGRAVESCADPSVIEGEDGLWTMYCTTDPLSGEDGDEGGGLVFHLLPTFRSADLVSWDYAGDAFDRDPATPTPPPPDWAARTALLWAPEAEVIDGRHYLLFGVTDVREGGEPGCDSDGAIGYAVSDSPVGPWDAAEAPLVAPRRAGPGCDFLWTYDPEVIATPEGRWFIYYGSYHGGIEVRELTVAADGSLSADPATAVRVAVADRYEGAEVVWKDGAYWLFVSASNCCNGPQTGYAVFVGRAESPLGPFRDREGVSLLDARVGGTPVLAQNGNGWVGPGHNTVLQDQAGDWWTIYHAVEEARPWFGEEVGFTRRPAMLDRLDWVEGWPVVAGGPSDGPRAAPALGPDRVGVRDVAQVRAEGPGALLPAFSDEFEGEALDGGWSWVREPEGHGLARGALGVAVTDTDLHEDSDDAPVLLREAPGGDFMLETQVALDVPGDGCCFNYVQAGLVLHGDDDNYFKLVVVSVGETRQTEFAREMGPVPEGGPRYGSSVVGPPGEAWTWLRLVVRRGEGGESVTAWTSPDGEDWARGATWTHDLGEDARIGLVAMGGPGGFAARFEHLRVSRLGE